jgi:hypothetical protein
MDARSVVTGLLRAGFVALLVAACGGGVTTGTWQGPDVHLVDGTWIGTEHTCGDGPDDLRCRTIVERAKAALPTELRDKVTTVVLADLPTKFLTSGGEVRTGHIAVGIETLAAVVVNLTGGTRQVIGLHCYLPSDGAGKFEDAMSTCAVAPIDDWLDGQEPPTVPPGTTAG